MPQSHFGMAGGYLEIWAAAGHGPNLGAWCIYFGDYMHLRIIPALLLHGFLIG